MSAATVRIDNTGGQAPAFHIHELLAPRVFPHAVSDLRLVETYISWIVLTGELAYKVKKPVRFEFIDSSTLERRRMLCEEELRLNRRLAPDIYIDVVPLTRERDGLGIAGSGPTVEYAVRMRQFAPANELANQLGAGGASADELATLGARIAEFHRGVSIAGAESPYGDYDAVREQILGNIGVLLAALSGQEDVRGLGRLTDWTHAALAKFEPLLRLRKASGAVRECHGDLHARNIVRWHGAWTPFDCLEFEPSLRWIDVMSDVAFLFMDLLAHERADLAFAFLDRYLEDTGDYEGLRLLPFYAVYRALVRAKVDALAAQTSAPELARSMRARLADRIGIAVRLTHPEEPALIIMHGVAASGKSRLSEQLAPALAAIRLRSDLERKRLAGVEPLAQRDFEYRAGAYDIESTHRTYARLLECAEAALASGFSAIVDATFLDRRRRDLFQALARQRRCAFLILSCQADSATLERRIAERRRAGADASEATGAVLAEQLKALEPLTALEESHTVVIDTTAPAALASSLDRIRAQLEQAARC